MWDILSETWPFWVFVLIAIAAFSLLRIWFRPQRLPYLAREKLVTNSELRFYKSLRKAVHGDWQIFAMVRIADLLRVQEGVKNRRSWVNKILAKHIDFVLCESSTLKPVLCIELDDRSHQRKDRQERDEFVDEAFDSAGLPLLRVPVRSSYQSAEIRALIDRML